MLLGKIMTVFLLAPSVFAAPTNSSTSTVDSRSTEDDDPLETSETGHWMRRRLWRRLLKQVSGMGLGAYGLGGYGLGGYGLNFLSQIAHFQNHNNLAHHCGSHRCPTEYGGDGVLYGSNVLHHTGYPFGVGSHGGYYGAPVNYPANSGLGVVSPSGFGPWDSGVWGNFGNYGYGGPDGLHVETVWL